MTFARMKPSELMRRRGKYWGCRGCNECFESTRAFKRHLSGNRCMTDEEMRGRGLATAAATGSMSRVWMMGKASSGPNLGHPQDVSP